MAVIGDCALHPLARRKRSAIRTLLIEFSSCGGFGETSHKRNCVRSRPPALAHPKLRVPDFRIPATSKIWSCFSPISGSCPLPTLKDELQRELDFAGAAASNDRIRDVRSG